MITRRQAQRGRVTVENNPAEMSDNEDNQSLQAEEQTSREVIPSVVPKIFSGKSSESVEEFFKIFNRAARANRWNDLTKLLQLPCYLEGAALSYFETIEEECRDFEDASGKLKDSFKCATKHEKAYFQLISKKQQPLEDLWQFYHATLSLCHDVNPRMTDTEKIGFVLRGLQPKFLEKVNLMDNATLEKLRSNLQKVEVTNFMVGSTTPKPEANSSSSRSNTSGSQGIEMERLIQRIEKLERRPGRSNHFYSSNSNHNKFTKFPIKKELRSPQGQIVCFKCGKQGHYAKNCYVKNGSPRR